MRHAHYSNRVPTRIDWGAFARYVLIVLVLFAAGWWLLNGPAQDWFESLTDWLRDL